MINIPYLQTSAMTVRKYMGLIFPHASLLVHEIQHALRGTDHNSSSKEAHGPCTISIDDILTSEIYESIMSNTNA